MVTPIEVKRLISAGYQLTPESYAFLLNKTDIRSVVNEILVAKPENLVLKLEDIKKILKNMEEVKGTHSTLEIKAEGKESSEKKERVESQYEDSTSTLLRKRKIETDLKILHSPKIDPKKVSVDNFRQYFISRYEKISSMFRNRKDITNIVTSSYLSSVDYKEQVSIVALVFSKNKTRNGSIILELEDKEGRIKGIIASSLTDVVKKSEYILEDTVLSFTGSWKNEVLFIKDIQWPDLPYNRKPNYANEDVFALFISDIHIGSKNFLNKLFMKAIKFLNGNLTSAKYNQLGKQVKYLFIAGDIVDGV
ncbi:MAG: hypothetical protein ACTSPI_12360, partial [Candidatus Heimdallarchaeaceae archaeon]